MSIICAEDSIIINEINYNSADSLFPKDWVELYNITTDSIDIGHWIFKDDNDVHEFMIPNNQILPPGGFIVICDSLNAFHISFPYVNNAIGDFDFKLRNDGELIRLFDDEGELIDSVRFNDVEPWPLEADGDGPTLELIDPHIDDNALPSNWAASIYLLGTPGEPNSNYIDCFGVLGGEAVEDCAGDCDGAAQLDCENECDGSAVGDMCGTCDDNLSNDCVQDCNGDWGGVADYDECTVPICSGGETGLTPNASCIDCAGAVNGIAELDCAGQCNGSAELDCANVCGGSSIEDCAGDCDGTAIEDCAGDCDGDAAVDECGECGGDGSECESQVPGCMNISACNYNPKATFDNENCEEFDCLGECGGSVVVDCAGECDGNAILDDCEICNGSNTTMDCAGVCNGDSNHDCAGQCNGNAMLDDCEICTGGWTGILPCVLANSIDILPLDFKIEGIYPNPFNPITRIHYSLPEYAKIQIKVYDSNGGLVTELVNASIQPGHYSVEWNATDYASGVYFVKMVAGDYMQNQKLMLLK